MKFSTWNKFSAGAALGFALTLATALAAPPEKIDKVQFKGGVVTTEQNGKPVTLEEEVTLPNEVKVKPDGSFIVGKGKPRQLKEGQSISADGTLASADGSVMPVVDHVVLKNGRPLLVTDGESTPITSPVTLGDGTVVLADGAVVRRGASPVKLLDGQLLKLDGSALATRDTVTFKDGKVTVQKDGSTFEVKPGRTLMMNDGTKVFGDGTVVKRSGDRQKLTEGQTITVEGVVTRNR